MFLNNLKITLIKKIKKFKFKLMLLILLKKLRNKLFKVQVEKK